MRLFTAIDVTDEAKLAIAAEQKRVAAGLGAAASALKWVQPAHMHLTLAFLGEVDEARSVLVADAMRQPIGVGRFEMVFKQLSAFPPQGAPRTLWLGVDQGAAEVIDVEREVTVRLNRLGCVLEHRAFHPHLTLARWRDGRGSDRRRVLALDRGAAIARVDVTRVSLYQSRLSSAGPQYTLLTHAELQA
jgi:2'-5' RNA ligase